MGSDRTPAGRSGNDRFPTPEDGQRHDRIPLALDAIRPADAEQDATLFGLKQTMLKRRIKAACKAAGIDGASSHGCRVGMAQDLARTAGVDMPAIMQAGGWRTEKMVARYTAREQAARGVVARFYA